jgi:hypothetical protein
MRRCVRVLVRLNRDGNAVLTVSPDDVRMMCCRRDDVLACRLQVNSTCAHQTAAGSFFLFQTEAVSSETRKALLFPTARGLKKVTYKKSNYRHIYTKRHIFSSLLFIQYY